VTDAPVDPARLRLARELREWNQADLASRLDISAAAVSQFEAGTTRPSAQLLRRMSQVLDVPIEFLALPLLETHEGFFRSLRRTSVAHRRRARALAHIAYDLAVSVAGNRGADIPQLPITDLKADRRKVEQAAAGLRRAWAMPAGPVPNVVRELESRGVVVIRLPLDTADVDAFSLPFFDHPVVVLASDKNDKARARFDAAHEIGHLVIHGQQLWGVKEVEQQAHAFAAAFLMPANDIIDELPVRPDWPVLFDLKRKWQVSLAALLMRARTLGRMSEGQYLTAIKAASARGWRRVEPVPLGRPEQPQKLAELLSKPASRKIAQVFPPDVVQGIAAATAA
jgi:Zn-dependent peptidase ImmA (M78 family)/transcriptional regulator with XRE-family HTH domain